MSHEQHPEGPEKIVEVIEVVEIIEIIDLEEFSKSSGGKKPPHAKKYKVRIDRQHYELTNPTPNGRELLTVAGKTPPDRFIMTQKLHGGHVRTIGLEQVVDLREPGVERFMTLPKDPTEGLRSADRRHFDLSAADVEFLNALALPWETIIEQKNHWVLIHNHPVPAGYNVTTVTAAVLLPTTYPDTQIDMVYFAPHLSRADGGTIRQLTSRTLDGASFQQWSRHRTKQNPWRAGLDDLSSHMLMVRHWLEREIPQVNVGVSQ